MGDLDRMSVSTERHQATEVVVETIQVGPLPRQPIQPRSDRRAWADRVQTNPTSLEIKDPGSDESLSREILESTRKALKQLIRSELR